MKLLHSREVAIRAAVLALGALSGAGSVFAAEINLDNTDLSVRFDNTVRYNLGFRMQDADPVVLNTPALAVGDAQFKKHDIVNNRLDLLSELDVGYKAQTGFRLSGAAWRDFAWDDQIKVPAGAIGGSSYYGDRWSTKFEHEIYNGGELLDAYVWTKVDLGDATTQFKLGRHSAFWGVSLFPQNLHASIAQGQSGVDLNKAALSPGMEAKELFLPQNQLTINSSVNSTTSVAFQYVFDPSQVRNPPGGAFLGAYTGFLFDAPDYYTLLPAVAPLIAPYGANTTLYHAEDQKPKRGDVGLMVRTTPEWLDGTLGLYYRRYSDKSPTTDFGGNNALASLLLGAAIPAWYRVAYDQNNFNQLLGASLEKNWFGMNFGFEVSYRKNTGLYVDVSGPDHVGARGNLWNGIANVVTTLSATPLYDGGVLAAEVSYQRLQSVSHNESQFRGIGYSYCTTNFPGHEFENGCATKDAFVTSILFSPQWQAALPGVDLSLPVFVTYGLKGNAPGAGTLLVNEGSYSYAIGLEADIRQAYKVELGYSASYAKKASTYGSPAATGGLMANGNGLPWLNDRGILTLSLRTTF